MTGSTDNQRPLRALTPGVPLHGLGPALSLCEALAARSEALKPGWNVPADPVDRIVLATYARCETTFGIVLDLVRQGHSPHGTALSRLMAEDCEVAHWLIATRPDNVIRLVHDHSDWQNLRLLGDDVPSLVGITPERAEALRKSFKRAGDHWTRTGTKGRRKAIIEKWPETDARAETLDQLNSQGDVWANAMLHHSPWGIDFAFSSLGTAEQPRFTTDPSWRHSYAAIRFAYLSLVLLLSLCDAEYGASGTQTFAEFFGDDGLELLNETDKLCAEERNREAVLAKTNESN